MSEPLPPLLAEARAMTESGPPFPNDVVDALIVRGHLMAAREAVVAAIAALDLRDLDATAERIEQAAKGLRQASGRLESMP